MANDSELLTGLSDDELEALAESKLAAASQAHVETLLAQNADGQLPSDDQAELDRILTHVDQLNILKARARFTLARKAGTSAS